MDQTRLTSWPRVVLVFIVVLTAFRPGDAPWINDEPLMMEIAIRCNHTASHLYGFALPFTPSPIGLQGTRGMRYGPLPIWLDQIFLSFTHNLLLMLVIRAVLFSGITAIAMSWLARTLRTSAWFAVIVMMSPLIWMYSRSLWDNTWCIPVSAMLLASYADFLARKTPRSLTIAAACCLVLPTIHLMALAMSLPFILHSSIFLREEIWRWRWRICAVVLVCAYLFWPFLTFSFANIHPARGEHQSALLGWIFPLWGGTFQTVNVEGTLIDWQNYVPSSIRTLADLARWISLGAHLAVWLGMILAAPRALAVIRRLRPCDVVDHLCLISLSVWLTQSVLDGMARVYATWHYYAGTWCVYAFFAWLAVDWLWQRVPKPILFSAIAIYATSLLIGVVVLAAFIARNAGVPNSNFGTTLGNQIAAVAKINRFSYGSSIDILLPQWEQFPWALQVLQQLNPPPPTARPMGNLVVKYRDAWRGDAHIEVDELPGS